MEHLAVKVGQEIVSNSLLLLFGWLESAVVKELALFWGVNDELRKLHSTLSIIQAVLSDAEDRQVNEKGLGDWLRNLKDAAYDAEDILDEFATEALRAKVDIQDRRRLRYRVKNKVHKHFSSSNPIVFRFKMGHEIKNIQERLDVIAQERFKYNLRMVTVDKQQEREEDRREPNSFVAESEVYGREGDKAKLLNWLINCGNEEDDVSVISIVGMGGLGKTTLAKLVYNSESVEKHFEARMWVSVSGNIDVQRIAKEIAESATVDEASSSNMNQLGSRLKKIVNGKRYLLIFDDVWIKDRHDHGLSLLFAHHEKWDQLKTLLGGGAKGSKIIVTTRDEKVAKIMGTLETIKLKGLTEDDCWLLFKKRAFGVGGVEETPNLVEIGRKIVEKCKGVPLAAKALGSLMCFRGEETEWLSIKESEIWNLPEDENGILSALSLSYNPMPSHLKLCFAYCALFPKDHYFDKRTLIQLWMAEDFLQPHLRSMEMMEDLGNQYFNDLLWRSFFQDANKDEYGNITTCKMHDLVCDLATSVAGSTCSKVNARGKEKICERSRHVSFDFESEVPSKNLEALLKAKKLRTFISFGPSIYKKEDLQNIFSSFSCLRVLDLSWSNIKNLPKSIGKLKHLRYLDLSGTEIETFPKNISYLYNLQTLKLLKCKFLRELPKDMRKMISLRHVEIENFEQLLTKMPVEIGRLCDLQTLTKFIVSKERGCGIEELRDLNLRGDLQIVNLQNVRNDMDAKRANLKEKQLLHQLCLSWSDVADVATMSENEERILERHQMYENEEKNILERRQMLENEENILDGLQMLENVERILEGLQPHKNLKQLSIEFYPGLKFPNWMMDCSLLMNLVEIQLNECRKCVHLPPFGQLRHLKVLSIRRMDGVEYVSDEFHYKDTTKQLFPSLKQLEIIEMPNLKGWSREVKGEEMQLLPSLQMLYISNCPKLESLPTLLGLTSLRYVVIEKCPAMTCLPKGFKGLRSLWISGCPQLEKQFQKERFKIAHIPNVQIGNTLLSFFVGILYISHEEEVMPVGEAVLSAFLQLLFVRLDGIISKELGFLLHFKDELRKLRNTLVTIRAVLADAEDRQVKEKALGDWLGKLKDAAYDADDILDEFAADALRVEVEIQDRTRLRYRVKNKVRKYSSSSNPIVFLFKMGHEIKNIQKRLDVIVKDKSKYDLRVVIVDRQLERREDRRDPNPFVAESEVYGREADKTKLLNWLINCGNEVDDVSVISIVGMGGIGKTTLAELVYNSESVEKRFEPRKWVPVSGNIDVQRIAEEIAESATVDEASSSNMKELGSGLKKIVNGKRYLLIFDDVWIKDGHDHEKWDQLKTLLGGGAKGSKIIVTTRDEKVAKIMGTLKTIKLKGLTEDDCWLLFKKRAFGVGGVEETPNLVEIGRKIVEKCKGVPLAAKALGSLMCFRGEETEWLSIKESEIWNLPEDENEILSALRLSYNPLPSHMKQCFSYCALFPKDHKFEKRSLIQLWMAQGFLQPNTGSMMMMEDLGTQYFNDLLWRSFFQDADKDKYGNITTCKMHDLVRDLARSVVGSERSMVNAREIPSICGRSRQVPSKNLEALREAEKLRTFISFGPSIYTKENLQNIFLRFRCLRVLDLSWSNIKNLPKSIGKLKHLRYLDLSGTDIETFPKNISYLYNLQTLKLLKCKFLRDLPKDMRKMISLRHLEIEKSEQLLTKMPVEIGRLCDLQTLTKFIVSKRGCGIEELQDLNLRGDLQIEKLQNVRDAMDAKKANLKGKLLLHQLCLSWSDDVDVATTSENEERILEGLQIFENEERDLERLQMLENEESIPDRLQMLKNEESILEWLQPHKNLKRLSIERYQGLKFPSWMMDCSLLMNIVEINLNECRKCVHLPPFGQLRSLKVLSIRRMDGVTYVSDEFHYEDTAQQLFPSLKELELIEMPNLKGWCREVEEEEIQLPSLQRLHISNCPKLKSLPRLLGIAFLSDVIIEKCPALSCLPEGFEGFTSLRSL
ncbi:uncharacterized protein LOC143863368 [Tasmannia lanceolata]|uniref:uncharacterized protein LOC143863368 n=1 Tax=Tasmannia lanceolata TaxID=3420 RepID=UPI0040642165